MNKQVQQFEEPLGKVHDVRNEATGRVVYPAEERAVCRVHGKRDKTTVNGVCLPCMLSKGHRPSNRRRRAR